MNVKFPDGFDPAAITSVCVNASHHSFEGAGEQATAKLAEVFPNAAIEEFSFIEDRDAFLLAISDYPANSHPMDLLENVRHKLEVQLGFPRPYTMNWKMEDGRLTQIAPEEP